MDGMWLYGWSVVLSVFLWVVWILAVGLWVLILGSLIVTQVRTAAEPPVAYETGVCPVHEVPVEVTFRRRSRFSRRVTEVLRCSAQSEPERLTCNQACVDKGLGVQAAA